MFFFKDLLVELSLVSKE